MSDINACVIAALLSVLCISCQAMPFEEMCKVPRRQRVECGWSGISAAKCRGQGCCWDGSSKNYISCFKSDERVSNQGVIGRLNQFQAAFAPMAIINGGEKSTMRSCTAEPRDRVDCGWSSISRKMCESRGCCFERSKGGPWCFQPDSLLIGSRVRSMLECTWECSRTSWRKIAGGYSRCGTNTACWMLVVGQSTGTCLTACKTNQDIDAFIGNITDCLRLDREEARTTYLECDTDLPCWVDLHGEEALRCFQRNSVAAKHYGVEIPEDVEEVIDYENEYYEEQEPENPESIHYRPVPDELQQSEQDAPVEEEHTPKGTRPEYLRSALRTHIQSEMSSHHEVDIEHGSNEEEYPPEEES